MATQPQILANRENSQSSTGPRTPAGIAACRHNATKHGLSGKQTVIRGEDPADYDALRASFLDTYRPANETEAMLVEQLTQNWWKLQRAARLEPQIQNELGRTSIYTEDKAMKKWANFQRHRSAVERSWRHALTELQKLQRARTTQTPQAPVPAPILPSNIGSVLQRAAAFTKQYPLNLTRSSKRRRRA